MGLMKIMANQAAECVKQHAAACCRVTLCLLQHAKDGRLQDCARDGVAVMPRKGDALLFYSLQLDGSLVR